jgi:hypothetical protein
MLEVKEQSITNAQTQKWANVPDILIFLTRRSLCWIGKLARMPMNRLPRRLLAAWVKNPQKRGRPATVHPMQHHDQITPRSPPGPSVPTRTSLWMDRNSIQMRNSMPILHQYTQRLSSRLTPWAPWHGVGFGTMWAQ